MKLYHAITMYQILECIIHRIMYNKEEKCVLVLPDFIVEKYPQYMKLKENKLFDEIFLFSYMKIEHSESELLERLTENYNRDIGISLRAFDDFYIAGVHFYFSILLIENGIYFNVFEEAAYNIFNFNKLEVNISTKFPDHARIANKYGLISYDCAYIKKVYVCRVNKEVKVEQRRFVLKKQLQKLDKKIIQKIMDCFDVQPIVLENKAVIVLTEQFYNLGIISKQVQKELYKNVFTYVSDYIGTVIYVKPHPDDKIDYLENRKVCGILNSLLPAELLPYQIKGKKVIIVTISSTAIIGLRSLRRKIYVLKTNSNFKKMLYQKTEFSKLLEYEQKWI